ncbi:MAG TPA: ABC transporter ATP-binding protein [Planctomycetota bacterium]|nr:ABC transporter ATP-binding protein [Planctomycetota bacterium]
MNAVELASVRKSYGARLVLGIDDLVVPERELLVVVGPSGSGKTTLLRILAGLVRPDAGRVTLFGRDALPLPPHLRDVGVVFQGLALWPHLSVRGNIALGLDRLVPAPAERRARIEQVAAELGIARFLESRPMQLSGGERQRVALARALARRPRLLLLDEPFSDLDARLHRETARLVRRLHDGHGMTTLLITHDRTDAHLLADRIGVMRAGGIVALGAPDQLHVDPGSVFAAEFLTDAAILSGEARADGTVETALGTLRLRQPASGRVHVSVRPDEVRIGAGPVRGTVIACEFAGGRWRCRVQVGEEEVAALSDEPLHAGAAVSLAGPDTPRAALREDA